MFVRVGSVHKCGGWDLSDTYFESDEEYEEEVKDIEEAKKILKKEYNGIYDIRTNHKGVIQADVY